MLSISRMKFINGQLDNFMTTANYSSLNLLIKDTVYS